MSPSLPGDFQTWAASSEVPTSPGGYGEQERGNSQKANSHALPALSAQACDRGERTALRQRHSCARRRAAASISPTTTKTACCCGQEISSGDPAPTSGTNCSVSLLAGPTFQACRVNIQLGNSFDSASLGTLGMCLARVSGCPPCSSLCASPMWMRTWARALSSPWSRQTHNQHIACSTQKVQILYKNICATSQTHLARSPCSTSTSSPRRRSATSSAGPSRRGTTRRASSSQLCKSTPGRGSTPQPQHGSMALTPLPMACPASSRLACPRRSTFIGPASLRCIHWTRRTTCQLSSNGRLSRVLLIRCRFVRGGRQG